MLLFYGPFEMEPVGAWPEPGELAFWSLMGLCQLTYEGIWAGFALAQSFGSLFQGLFHGHNIL